MTPRPLRGRKLGRERWSVKYRANERGEVAQPGELIASITERVFHSEFEARLFAAAHDLDVRKSFVMH